MLRCLFYHCCTLCLGVYHGCGLVTTATICPVQASWQGHHYEIRLASYIKPMACLLWDFCNLACIKAKVMQECLASYFEASCLAVQVGGRATSYFGTYHT